LNARKPKGWLIAAGSKLAQDKARIDARHEDDGLKMAKFVFWSGVYNVGLAAVLAFPPLYRALGLNVPTPFWGWLTASFLGYTGAALILSSADLRRRAAFVYWEAFLRYLAALLLIPAGLFGDLGLIAAPLGLVDLLIGLAFMFGLPRELGRSHQSLLWDRAA
jgi:hypothetical protein